MDSLVLTDQVYDERLAKVEEMMTTLGQLSLLLGPPFDPPAPLKEIPDSSAVPARAAPRRSTIAPFMTAPTTNLNKRHSARNTTPQPEAPPQPQTWLDVGEDVMGSLEKAVSEALAERVSASCLFVGFRNFISDGTQDVRMRNLETNFNDLIWFAAELDLPPLPKGLLDEFPERLLPPSTMEETPGAFGRYTNLLSSIMAVNEAWQGEDDEEAPEIQGMEGVEPEVGLMNWAEQLLELWANEKDARDGHIQELYEKIEPLWQRLEVPQEEIDVFIESNRGSGESTIHAVSLGFDGLESMRPSQLTVSTRTSSSVCWRSANPPLARLSSTFARKSRRCRRRCFSARTRRWNSGLSSTTSTLKTS